MKQFASSTMPIRASNLPKLLTCVRGFVLATIHDGEDEAGEPAQTGSLIHFGIQMYHQNNCDKNVAMVSLQKGYELWPEANKERAAEHVHNYIQREKEESRGQIIYTEQKIKLKIKPAAFDPTKTPIIINGTVDQIRRLGEWYYVIDFKSGFRPGEDMVRMYTPQLAAYMIGGGELIKSKKVKAFIARTEDLKSRRYPYWWEMPFDLDGANKIMDSIRALVAVVRMGGMPTSPGKHCEWCFSQWYYPNCIMEKGQKRANKKIGLQVTTSRETQLTSISELFGNKL